MPPSYFMGSALLIQMQDINKVNEYMKLQS